MANYNVIGENQKEMRELNWISLIMMTLLMMSVNYACKLG